MGEGDQAGDLVRADAAIMHQPLGPHASPVTSVCRSMQSPVMKALCSPCRARGRGVLGWWVLGGRSDGDEKKARPVPIVPGFPGDTERGERRKLIFQANPRLGTVWPQWTLTAVAHARPRNNRRQSQLPTSRAGTNRSRTRQR